MSLYTYTIKLSHFVGAWNIYINGLIINNHIFNNKITPFSNYIVWFSFEPINNTLCWVIFLYRTSYEALYEQYTPIGKSNGTTFNILLITRFSKQVIITIWFIQH